MKKDKLIIYKKNIFTKIYDFFVSFFQRKKVLPTEVVDTNKNKRESFIQNIQIKENEELVRLHQLKQQYNRGEIDEEDLSKEDIDKLCEMYQKETDELNADTAKRKKHIAQMLKELKQA